MRMLKEDRVLKLVAKSDSAVAKGKKAVKESLEEASTAPEIVVCGRDILMLQRHPVLHSKGS